jgi:hypothetical protein
MTNGTPAAIASRDDRQRPRRKVPSPAGANPTLRRYAWWSGLPGGRVLLEQEVRHLEVAVARDHVVEVHLQDAVRRRPGQHQPGRHHVPQHEEHEVAVTDREAELRHEAPDVGLVEAQELAQVRRVRPHLDQAEELAGAVDLPEPVQVDEDDHEVHGRHRVGVDEQAVGREADRAHEVDEPQAQDRAHEQRHRHQDGSGVAEQLHGVHRGRSIPE